MRLKRVPKPGDVTAKVIKVMQTGPTAAYLRDCSIRQRLILASLLRCVKRKGGFFLKWEEAAQNLLYGLSSLSD